MHVIRTNMHSSHRRWPHKSQPRYLQPQQNDKIIRNPITNGNPRAIGFLQALPSLAEGVIGKCNGDATEMSANKRIFRICLPSPSRRLLIRPLIAGTKTIKFGKIPMREREDHVMRFACWYATRPRRSAGGRWCGGELVILIEV